MASHEHRARVEQREVFGCDRGCNETLDAAGWGRWAKVTTQVTLATGGAAVVPPPPLTPHQQACCCCCCHRPCCLARCWLPATARQAVGCPAPPVGPALPPAGHSGPGPARGHLGRPPGRWPTRTAGRGVWVWVGWGGGVARGGGGRRQEAERWRSKCGVQVGGCGGLCGQGRREVCR